MSTAQNAVTAEPGNGSATIRARVGDSAIDKVTRLFSAGLADIFTETLQNSRRGGATRVTATIEQDGDTTRVTLIDDGAGIADPAVLLTFGESGWKAGIAEAEDPAGFGLLALSRRGCTLRWRVPGGENGGEPERPETIVMHLNVLHPPKSPRHCFRKCDTIAIPADLAFAGEAWSSLHDALPLVTADSDIAPEELARLLRAAFFSPSDDAEADSWETQLIPTAQNSDSQGIPFFGWM